MNSKKRRLLILAIIAVLLIIAIVVCIIFYANQGKFDSNKYKVKPGENNITVSYPDDFVPPVPLVENPIKFDELEKENPDIHGWITIPNTNIDYPIVQSFSEDDLFYVNHNIDKKKSAAGAIFTQKLNQRDFTDRNTVIYGHNMRNGSMFRHLHKFKKEDFFNENRYIYIYTRGHILTYEIIAAYEYDSRHILNSFDFSNDEVYKEYLEYIQNPKSIYKNIKEYDLTTDDKIVTLSTCLANNTPDKRYLVQGVLIKDELTY